MNRDRRAPASAGGICGIAYVDRIYQLAPGAEPGPLVNPIAWQANCDGYQCLVFLHERGIFSALVIRSTDDRDLVGLRHNAAFDAAVAAIPGLAEWTDPERSRPLTDVLPGGTLKNAYRSQRGPDGELALPGLLFVGDSVCTTTPNFGRGLATTMLQVDEVLRLADTTLDVAGAVTTQELTDLGEAFDAWTEANMRPWVEDHAVMDESLRRRWAGEDVDLSAAPAPVRPRHGGGPRRRADRAGHRPVRRHAGAPLRARPGRAAGPRRLRDRLATPVVATGPAAGSSSRSSSRAVA